MGFGRPSKEDLYWLEKANHYAFSENKGGFTSLDDLYNYLIPGQNCDSRCKFIDAIQIEISKKCRVVFKNRYTMNPLLEKFKENDYFVEISISNEKLKSVRGLKFRTEDLKRSYDAISSDPVFADETELNNSPDYIEFKKQQKIKELAENNIKILLESELRDFNHPWNIKNDGKISSLLEIKLSNKRNLKIRISHKDFIEKVKSIKTFVSNLEQLEDENNLHMVIEYYGNNQEWKNG